MKRRQCYKSKEQSSGPSLTYDHMPLHVWLRLSFFLPLFISKWLSFLVAVLDGQFSKDALYDVPNKFGLLKQRQNLTTARTVDKADVTLRLHYTMLCLLISKQRAGIFIDCFCWKVRQVIVQGSVGFLQNSEVICFQRYIPKYVPPKSEKIH